MQGNGEKRKDEGRGKETGREKMITFAAAAAVCDPFCFRRCFSWRMQE